jgi:hypothetical protein
LKQKFLLVKPKTQWRATPADRISELEDKIEIKEKPEEILVKNLKSYERNVQELSNSIK